MHFFYSFYSLFFFQTDKYDSSRNELSLECIVRGRPKTIWYKDGAPISNNRYQVIEETGGIRKLLIRNPLLNDHGIYTCRSIDTDTIEEINLNIDNNINFEKSSSSSSLPSLPYSQSFLPLQQQINGESHHHFDDDYNSLRKRLDAVIDSSRKYVDHHTLHRKRLDNEIRLTTTSGIYYTKDYSPVRTRRDITVESIRRYGEEYYSSSNTNRFSVPIEYIRRSDENYGLTRKRIGNTFIETSKRYSRDRLWRTDDITNRSYDTRKRPIFSTHLTDRNVAENSTIKLTCNVLGDVNTNISWLKNNSPLLSSTKYRTLYDNGLASLEIFSVQPSDSGNYTCIAQNLSGESYSNAQLKVYKGYEATKQPPVFTRFIKGIHIKLIIL